MNKRGAVYMIPAPLDEDTTNVMAPYIHEAIKNCQVFFVEKEGTTRRYLKKILKKIEIDNYEWCTIKEFEKSKVSENFKDISNTFKQKLIEGKNIGILSEAGCPGIADPGQLLVAIAHEMDVQVKPLVGPSSFLLALMASGLNGQQFRFSGYLPINRHILEKTLKELETESQKKNCTEIFIETPYRNNQLIQAILKTCKPLTKLCIAANLTSQNEFIKTKTIQQWHLQPPDIHKQPAIFLLYANR